MAYVSYDKLWRSDFYNNVSAKYRDHDIYFNQLKLKVNVNYKKMKEKATKLEPSKDEDVINKAYLDKKLSKMEGQISYIEKDYNEFKLFNSKKSAEEILIEKAVKTTIPISYDKGLFDFLTTEIK